MLIVNKYIYSFVHEGDSDTRRSYCIYICRAITSFWISPGEGLWSSDHRGLEGRNKGAIQELLRTGRSSWDKPSCGSLPGDALLMELYQTLPCWGSISSETLHSNTTLGGFCGLCTDKSCTRNNYSGDRPALIEQARGLSCIVERAFTMQRLTSFLLKCLRRV